MRSGPYEYIIYKQHLMWDRCTTTAKTLPLVNTYVLTGGTTSRNMEDTVLKSSYNQSNCDFGAGACQCLY